MADHDAQCEREHFEMGEECTWPCVKERHWSLCRCRERELERRVKELEAKWLPVKSYQTDRDKYFFLYESECDLRNKLANERDALKERERALAALLKEWLEREPRPFVDWERDDRIKRTQALLKRNAAEKS
jgi:hypothetical protein